jgi:hypothetical protein
MGDRIHSVAERTMKTSRTKRNLHERIAVYLDRNPAKDVACGKPPGFLSAGQPDCLQDHLAELVKHEILKVLGYRRALQALVRAILQESASKRPGRIRFLRARVESIGDRVLVFGSGKQTTGMLKNLAPNRRVGSSCSRAQFVPGERRS